MEMDCGSGTTAPEWYTKMGLPQGEDVPGRLGRKALTILKEWVAQHWGDPYPGGQFDERAKLASSAGISVTQLNDWLRNERKRMWAPCWLRQLEARVPELKANNSVKQLPIGVFKQQKLLTQLNQWGLLTEEEVRAFTSQNMHLRRAAGNASSSKGRKTGSGKGAVKGKGKGKRKR